MAHETSIPKPTSKGTVHLLDYVAGNIRSLTNAIETCGYSVQFIKSPADVASASKIILPGVGHFGHCLTSLSQAGYLPLIQKHIEDGKPFFGICVGLQALFEGSEEAPDVAGLGLCKGTLKRFKGVNASGGRKSVPCIGWNSATLQSPANVSSSSPTSNSNSTSNSTSTSASQSANSNRQRTFYSLSPSPKSKFYYVHSYFAPHTPSLESQGWTVATATYGDETYIGALGKDNVFATQFHPEKSGAAGLRVLKAFLDGRKWEDIETPAATTNEMAESAAAAATTNGLTRRIIACLDVRANDAGDLVVTKGDQYDVREKSAGQAVRNLGKPIALAHRYYSQSADEITFLNITSFRNIPLSDLPMLEILRKTSESVFVPLTIGGGIRDVVDTNGKTIGAVEVAKTYFESGADKVSIGSDAVVAAEEWWKRRNENGATGKGGEGGDGSSGIERISKAYGSQAVVVSVDPRRVFVEGPGDGSVKGKGYTVIKTTKPDASGREYVYYACTIKGGRETRDLDVVQLVVAVEAMGAGEILLNAIDRDGTNRGYDLELIRLVKGAVSIPVIASSGAGKPEHFEEVFKETDVDAALGAGMFHRGEWTVNGVKEYLSKQGMVVRPFEEFE